VIVDGQRCQKVHPPAGPVVELAVGDGAEFRSGIVDHRDVIGVARGQRAGDRGGAGRASTGDDRAQFTERRNQPALSEQPRRTSSIAAAASSSRHAGIDTVIL